MMLGLMAAVLAFNGFHMLLAPTDWYQSLTSVPHTGPFNGHFIRDIGCAYLAAASGLALGVWKTRWLVPAALPALIFLGLHALIHSWEALIVHSDAAAHADLTEFLGVYGPPLLTLSIVIFTVRSTRES
jgi:hypothetical protein